MQYMHVRDTQADLKVDRCGAVGSRQAYGAAVRQPLSRHAAAGLAVFVLFWHVWQALHCSTAAHSKALYQSTHLQGVCAF